MYAPYIAANNRRPVIFFHGQVMNFIGGVFFWPGMVLLEWASFQILSPRSDTWRLLAGSLQDQPWKDAAWPGV